MFELICAIPEEIGWMIDGAVAAVIVYWGVKAYSMIRNTIKEAKEVERA